MAKPRWRCAQLTNNDVIVVAISTDEYNKLDETGRKHAQIVKIRPVGMVSEELALSWGRQIAEQLNRADTSILGMSGINKIT